MSAALEGRLAALEAQLAAQDRALTALAVVLAPAQRQDLLMLLRAQAANALVCGEGSAAKALLGLQEQLFALMGSELAAGPADVRARLGQQTLMFATAPPPLKSAQALWLAAALPEEIAQELDELLRRLGGADGKAKPDGGEGSGS